MTNDKDKRIKRLEEKVEKLENAVRMPTRREAIAAGGIGLAGLAGFSSGASAASPSDAVGPVYFEQIGDSDNPVSEFYVDKEYQAESDQNPVFDSVTADQASINGPLDAESATVESVDTDWLIDVGTYGSIQEALNTIPSNTAKTVYIPDGTYEESVTVPNFVTLIGSGVMGVEINPPAGNDYAVTLNSESQLKDVLVHMGDVAGIKLTGIHAGVYGVRSQFDQTFCEIDSKYNTVVGNKVNSSDIVINTGADRNAVVGNSRVATITDNGTGNEVTSNS